VSGASATGRFSYVVSDSGGTANGGRDRIAETITIQVSLGVNSHPALSRFLRAYNPTADYHFFTTNPSEFAAAIRGGYVDENTGRTGFSLIESADDRAVPVYRLYNFGTGRHYYTTNSAERDYLIGLVPQSSPDYGKRGWRNEGSEGLIYPTAQPGTIEVFRLYNRASGVHLYVESAAIRDAVLRSAPNIWEQHDSLGFAFFAPAGAAATAAPSFAAAEGDSGASLAVDISPAISTSEPQEFSWLLDSGPDVPVGLIGPSISGESPVAPDSRSGSIDEASGDFGLDSSTDGPVETEDPNLDHLWTQITKSLTFGELLDIV